MLLCSYNFGLLWLSYDTFCACLRRKFLPQCIITQQICRWMLSGDWVYGIGTALFCTRRTAPVALTLSFSSSNPFIPFPLLRFLCHNSSSSFSATETLPSVNHPWLEWVSFIDHFNTTGYLSTTLILSSFFYFATRFQNQRLSKLKFGLIFKYFKTKNGKLLWTGH